MSSSGIAWKIMQLLMKCSLQILLSWLNLLEYFEQRFLHRYEIMLYTNQQRNKPPRKKKKQKTNLKTNHQNPTKQNLSSLPGHKEPHKKKFTALMMTNLHGMPLDAQTTHHYENGNSGDKQSKEADAILSIIYVVIKTMYFRGYQLKK